MTLHWSEQQMKNFTVAKKGSTCDITDAQLIDIGAIQKMFY